jgi:glycolate oxidase FAD binding subunit
MSAALDALAAELGEGALVRHAPEPVDGVAIAATIAPRDAEALAAAIRALGRAGLSAVPRGGGRQLWLGNPPARADVFLSTAGLAGAGVFEPAEGVCRAEAGTRISELRRTVAAEGWELPLDAPAAATLGGALATASIGPRSHGFGRARDAVLGLSVVLGSGERTRCGGRVVKNVTGYDLAKLYTGSLGGLCVIESAWLRLRPRPETQRVLARRLDADTAFAQALAAARRGTTRACALLDGRELVVELAGDAAGVAGDADAIGADACDASRIDALAALQWEGGGIRYRIAATASELPAVHAPLLRAGARTLAYPGLSLVYAWADLAGAQALAAAVDAAARAASGPVRCEVAPVSLKRGRDVFNASRDEALLTRALKQRFDPVGVLSPGRLAGCV